MTTKLYPDILFEPRPTEFSGDVDAACEAIHDACKGFGTNEGGLIAALATQTPEMRYLINERYEEMYGIDLRKVLAKEVKGDLGFALQCLGLPLNEAEALMLKEAMSGLGTKEKLIYPILCGRANEDIIKLKETYFDKYGDDLGVKLAGELNGDFERLVFHCIQGLEEPYDEEYHTEEKAKEDADTFHEAGVGRLGSDEAGLFVVVAKSPPEHLKQVNAIYVDKNDITITKALEKELHNDAEDGAMYAVGMKLKPAETVAKLIHDSVAGMGTNETLLTCTLIRYQSMMKEIHEAYYELYGKNLDDVLKKELRGDYEKILLEVVNAGCS